MKKMRKFLIVVSSLVSSFLLLTAASCGGFNLDFGQQGGSGTENEKVEIKPEISFSVSEKTLTIGDEEYLFPEYKKTQGYTLSYETSDAAIVQVNNDGKISAQSEGSATISAIYSNGSLTSKANILVNSSFSGYLP